jgi:hypothetical protein
MKAGGLDMIAVYVFWIHHEEVEGQWTFGGRRNVSHFFHLAQEVGLKVMARVGPWDHGECRNGGHPDWLLAKKIPLRTNDTAYMGYVEKFYAQLSMQLKGMFWKDGGPIIAVQIDNETRDWEYLLALKDVAVKVSIDADPLLQSYAYSNTSIHHCHTLILVPHCNTLILVLYCNTLIHRVHAFPSMMSLHSLYLPRWVWTLPPSPRPAGQRPAKVILPTTPCCRSLEDTLTTSGGCSEQAPSVASADSVYYYW